MTVTVCRDSTGMGARYVIDVSPVASGPMGAPTAAPAGDIPRRVFGKTGEKLTLIGHTPTGGNTPRSFAIDPARLASTAALRSTQNRQ